MRRPIGLDRIGRSTHHSFSTHDALARHARPVLQPAAPSPRLHSHGATARTVQTTDSVAECNPPHCVLCTSPTSSESHRDRKARREGGAGWLAGCTAGPLDRWTGTKRITSHLWLADTHFCNPHPRHHHHALVTALEHQPHVAARSRFLAAQRSGGLQPAWRSDQGWRYTSMCTRGGGLARLVCLPPSWLHVRASFPLRPRRAYRRPPHLPHPYARTATHLVFRESGGTADVLKTR